MTPIANNAARGFPVALGSAPVARRVLLRQWNGKGCYCETHRLGEDVPCPVCDAWGHIVIEPAANNQRAAFRVLPNVKVQTRRENTKNL